jgi:hypothetical protein
MGTHLVLGIMGMVQAVVASVPPPTPLPTPKTAPALAVLVPIGRCDARPWQRLVGRTVSDLLTVKLPAGTRIYRLDDPPGAAIASGRLTVELNRSTRVRRVYCS